MNKMDKEQWVDDALEQAQQMGRALPPDSLFRKIEQKLAEGVQYAKTVPVRTVSLAAAAIALLVVLNYYVLQNPKQQQSAGGVDDVIEYYGLNDNGINI